MSFFRTPIDTEVQRELFRRKQGINKEYISDELSPKTELDEAPSTLGDPFENEYFKTCWARAAVIDDKQKAHFLNGNVNYRIIHQLQNH